MEKNKENIKDIDITKAENIERTKIINTDYNVTQSNDLVESFYNMDINEYKVFMAIIGLVAKTDKSLKLYKLKTKDLCLHCGISERNALRNLNSITDRLMSKVVRRIEEIDGGEKVIAKYNLFENIKYNENYWYIEIKKELAPFLLNLTRDFTSEKLKNIKLYDNVVAARLNVIFTERFKKETYKFSKENILNYHLTVKFSLEDFKLIFGLDDKYKEFRNLNYRVISPALKNINEIKLYKVNLLKTYNSEGKVESITFDVTLGENNDYYKQIQQMIEDREKTEKKKAKVSSVLLMIGYKQKDVDYILKKNDLEEIISQLKALNDKEILEKEDQMEYLGSHLKTKIEKKNKETTIFAMIEEIDN